MRTNGVAAACQAMTSRYRVTSVADVHEEGGWVFTVRDEHGGDEEVLLVPCGDGVEAW
ncbi:hypothetical protein GCM10009000_121460 [Halobacterium noricense]